MKLLRIARKATVTVAGPTVCKTQSRALTPTASCDAGIRAAGATPSKPISNWPSNLPSYAAAGALPEPSHSVMDRR
jgi:hypothetical protein